MRQAGRSLPEYRAARGTGSILDAIRQPELAAELTLQPVRRYGVDAAILFTDIVVPAAAVGFGVEVGAGAGTGRRPALPGRRRTSPGCARSSPSPTPDMSLETVRLVAGELEPLGIPLIGFAGAPFTVASYLVEGGPSRVYARTKALMRGDPELWSPACSTRWPTWHWHLCGAQVGRVRPPCSSSTAGSGRSPLPTTSATSCRPAAQGLRRPRRSRGATHPLRGGHRRAARIDGGGRSRGRGRGLASAARRGATRVWVPGTRCRGTSTPPPAWLRGTSSRSRPATCSSAEEGSGTCSTSDTACCPRPIPTCWPASSSSCTHGTRRHLGPSGSAVKPVGVLVMAHGTPHSLDELRAFYTEIRRGSPLRPELLADLERRYRAIGGTSPLNERTAAQVEGIGAALEARAPGRFKVAAGAKFASPRISDAVRSLGRAGVSGLIGLVLAPHFSAVSVGDYAAPGPGRGPGTGPARRWPPRRRDDRQLASGPRARGPPGDTGT